MTVLKRALVAAIAVVALSLGVLGSGPATAADEPFKQVQLTDQMITNFIAEYHQKSGAPASEKPDPKVQADLDGIAKKSGFASYADFDDVAFNVSMVMGGLDPQGAFTDPIAAIKKEIEEINADKTIPEKDKKQMLEELTEALKTTPPLQFKENIEKALYINEPFWVENIDKLNQRFNAWVAK